MTTPTIERLSDVKARNLWVQWMKDATRGLDDAALVVTTTDRTPFGNYLLFIEPVRCPDCDEDNVQADDRDRGFCIPCGLTFATGEATR